MGHTATMQCRAFGNPTPTIYWLKDSVRVDMNNPRYTLIDGKKLTPEYSYTIIQP